MEGTVTPAAPEPEPLWYFGYGSNLCRSIFYERRGMRPLATRWGWLEGFRLAFNLPVGPGERGVANLEPEVGARTCGVLHLLTPEDVDRLDRSEGVHRGFYRRIQVEVLAEGEEPVSAFTYRSSWAREGRKPSPRYLGLLVEGARQHGLPREYVTFLESHALAWDERQEEHAMTKKTVRFYFAYNSPYSFLASSRIERELAPLGAEVQYKPVYSPRTGGAPDLNSPRFRYIFEDVARFAEAYGIQMNPGPFADSRKACVGFCYATEKRRGREYHDGVFRARWLEAGDIGREETLAEVAGRAGLAREEFLAALQDGRYAAALERSNEDARADGVFGFPFFVYGGRRFWGNDRIEWLAREIRKG